MKARRDARVLAVRAVWPEAGVKWPKTRIARLESELIRVARFADLDDVSFDTGWLRTDA